MSGKISLCSLTLTRYGSPGAAGFYGATPHLVGPLQILTSPLIGRKPLDVVDCTKKMTPWMQCAESSFTLDPMPWWPHRTLVAKSHDTLCIWIVCPFEWLVWSDGFIIWVSDPGALFPWCMLSSQSSSRMASLPSTVPWNSKESVGLVGLEFFSKSVNSCNSFCTTIIFCSKHKYKIVKS